MPPADRHWVCDDGLGLDLLEFDQDGRIVRTDSFGKILE